MEMCEKISKTALETYFDTQVKIKAFKLFCYDKHLSIITHCHHRKIMLKHERMFSCEWNEISIVVKRFILHQTIYLALDSCSSICKEC